MTRKSFVVSVCALLSFVPAGGARAETHRFVPTAFYGTFSAAHPPALHIRSGDRVMTTVLDDQGVGADGAVQTPGRHPQTGPFHIDGADPGDLLVVTIEALRPNRATGHSTSTIAAAAVGAGSLSNQDPTRFVWTLDAEAGLARLELDTVSRRTDWQARFESPAYELPLEVMLGSVAVAPPAPGALEATAVGRFGGNLAAADVTVGARVMLPVLQPGALLFLGGGRARQGDGGITGSGIETSLDVVFSVEVVERRDWPHSSVVRPSTTVGEFELGWPRVETDDYVMAVAGASTLDVAVQRATLELHHWLDDDFGLSEKAVSLLLGQALEYRLGGLGGPGVTVVAKIRKSYLPAPVVTPTAEAGAP